MKRTKARSGISNRMALIISIVLVLGYLILSQSNDSNPGSQEAVSTRSVAASTSVSKRQSTTTIRRTQVPRATTAPVAWVQPENGVLYAFHSKDFSDDSEPESLPIAKLGSFFLPPSTVRYEFTRPSTGYAEVRLLDVSDGCLPHGGADMVTLPYGPGNQTIFLLAQGNGCQFNAEIEWFDSTWSFWISNAAVATESSAESLDFTATVSAQSNASVRFPVTQVAARFDILVGGEVNLRDGPGTQFAKVGSILRGNTLRVKGISIGETVQGDNAWYEVTYRGGTAYIAKALTVRAN